jgi:uncharacterized membrane protein
MTYYYSKPSPLKWILGILFIALAALGPFIIFQRLNQFFASMGISFQLPTDPASNWIVSVSVTVVVALGWLYLVGRGGPGSYQPRNVGGKR